MAMEEHRRDVKEHVDETEYSRLRKAIGRNQNVMMEFQDRQICTHVAGHCTRAIRSRGMMMKEAGAMSSKQREFRGQVQRRAYSVRAGRERPPSRFYGTLR